jgi:hypothetical protein
LVVDNFGVKYVGREHAGHLKRVLEEHYYKVTADWNGERYVGIHMKWDYVKQQVHLYTCQTTSKRHSFNSDINSTKDKINPSPTHQFYMEPKTICQQTQSPPLNKQDKKFIRQVFGQFLFLGRAVDSILLTPISAIASQSAEPTEETMK